MNKKNIVPIVFTFDNNFFVPAIVTFYSMLKNSDENTFYVIFIMTDLEKFKHDNKEDILKLEKHFNTKCQINFINMKGFGKDFAIKDPRFNFTVYYRLFIHKYITEYDKVIFSDVDIVILKDLYPVFSTDINEYYLGATKQTKVNILPEEDYKKYINKADSIKQGNYFNAGFLLMNLDKIRKGDYDNEFIALSKVGFNNNDQDILNLKFQDQVKYIPIKYHYIPIDTYFDKLDKSKISKIHSPAEIDEYKKDPAIIHYLSTKPWNINSLEFVGDLDQDKYQLWWNTFYECLDFINSKAIFDLYKNLNNNIIRLGLAYAKEQTFINATKRLISISSKNIGIHSVLKSIEKNISK